MFQVLRQYPVLARGSVTPASHRNVMQRFDENAIRLKWYYRRAVHVVSNDHIVMQILRHAGVAYSGNDELYYNSVRAQVNKIATALKINTSVHANGAQRKSSFYGDGVKEYLVSVMPDYPRGLDMSVYWPTIQPLHVRYHPYSDLSGNIPDGKGTGTGYAVIEINIAMLMLQYVKWKQWVELHYETKPGLDQFVLQYPVLNMMDSHYDVCWANRYINAVSVTPNGTERKRYGLALPDLSNYADNDQETVIERIQRTVSSAAEVGQMLPMIFSESMWDFMLPPDIQYTRQNTVYHLMGLMPYLSVMAKISMQTGSMDNKVLALSITKALRTWDNARWFDQPDVDADKVKEFMAESVLRYLVV